MDVSNASARWARGRGALVAAFVWGFAEATLFFFVADIWVGWVAAHDAKRGAQAVLAATLGAILGGSLLFLAPGVFLPILPHVPGLSQGELDWAAQRVREHGLGALLLYSWTGVPFKVFAAQTGALAAGPFLAFLVVGTAARLLRFVPVALAFGLVGRLARGPFQRRPWLPLALALAFWTVAYVYYFGVVAPGFATRSP